MPAVRPVPCESIPGEQSVRRRMCNPDGKRRSGFPGSYIVEQRHEPVVHVQLLVTMKESRSWIVSREVNLCFLIAAHHHHILQHAGRRLPRDPREFKGVSMQMDRMDVIA